MPRPVLSLDGPQPSPKHQPKTFRFILTGRGKGNHQIIFNLSAEDGKAAMRLAREIIGHHVLSVEEVK